MGVDGVSGAGETQQPQRKRPEDYQEVDVKDSNKLAEHLAGVKEDLQEVYDEIAADGVVDESEKSELSKWKDYFKQLGANVQSHYYKARADFSQKVTETYLKIMDDITKFSASVDRVMNAKFIKKAEKEDEEVYPEASVPEQETTDAEKRQAAHIYWSPEQKIVREKFEGIMRLAADHPRAAASEINNIIARYSNGKEQLSNTQITTLKEIQKNLNQRADDELERLRNPQQQFGASFYDDPENGKRYAAIMKEQGHSHNLTADLGVVLPKDEQ